jgi:hypothetical protein
MYLTMSVIVENNIQEEITSSCFKAYVTVGRILE